MIFGETGRLPWAGDPRGLWKAWDDFGIQGTEMLPFFLEGCPVQTDNPDVLATVYRREGRSFVVLASWAKKAAQVRLQIDWKALGLDPDRSVLYAPPMQGMQEARRWECDEPVPVAANGGWFLVLDAQRPAHSRAGRAAIRNQ